MSKKGTTPDPHAEELAALAAMPDEAIDYSDLPETRFTDPARGRFFRPIKQRVTIRLDADLLAFFRERGPGYQTEINRALRVYRNATTSKAIGGSVRGVAPTRGGRPASSARRRKVETA